MDNSIIAAVFTALPRAFIAATLSETIVEITKLVVELVTLVSVITAMMVSLRNGRKTDDLRVKVDGQLKELLSVTGASEHAKGMLQGGTEGHAAGMAESADRRNARDEGRAAGVAEGEKRREAHEAGVAEVEARGVSQHKGVTEEQGALEGKSVVVKIEEVR